MNPYPNHTFLRISQVIEITGLARSTIYERIKQGDFPRAYKLGVRAVGWSSHEVFAWVNNRQLA